MKQKKWLYIGLFILTMVTLSLVIIVWQSGIPVGRSVNTSQSPPRITESPSAAATTLQAWMANNGAEDAQLVACTLTLSRRDPTEQGWTCQAYAAQKNQLLVALVKGQDIQMLRDTAARYRPKTLPATAWNQDIQTILKAWWRENGSIAWNAASTSSVTIHLGVREDGIPSWQLTLSKDKLNTLEYWEFNADTGTLLEHSSTGGQQ